MKLLNFFRKAKAVVDPMIGQTIIHFTTHGCQATEHEFDYIGKIVGTTYPRLCQGKMFYKVEVLKDRCGEKRDERVIKEFQEVPSWYLQNIGANFYIAYD
ncbi:MAG: hypothetical protein V4560_15020 [Bacteroidota bacterium]